MVETTKTLTNQRKQNLVWNFDKDVDPNSNLDETRKTLVYQMKQNFGKNKEMGNIAKRKYGKDPSHIEQGENISNSKGSVSNVPLKKIKLDKKIVFEKKKKNSNKIKKSIGEVDKLNCKDCGAHFSKKSHIQDHINGIHYNLK